MEAKAIARFQRVSPRKARLVVDLIRGKSVDEARTILKFSPRAAAEIVEKTLNRPPRRSWRRHSTAR